MPRITVVLVTLLAAVVVQAGVVRVPADQPTIQAGIDAASVGDTVLIADGTYSGSGNHNIDIGKILTVRSENGPVLTTIDCESSGRAFYIHDGTGVGPTIDGFTIKNGQASAAPVHRQAGGAIECWGYSGIFKSCVFLNNTASYGGALYFNPSLHEQGPVPGVSYPSVVNCTFVGNNVLGFGSVYYEDGNILTTFTECILYKNTGSGPFPAGQVVLQCCDVYGNTDQGGVDETRGNFSKNPLFCNSPGDDFTLSECSPCIRSNDHCTGLVGALGVGCMFGCNDLTVWHVSVSGNDLTGDGTSGSPFATVQRAVDFSDEGDTVLLANGTYTGPGNHDIDIDKNVTIRSENGPAVAIIDCDNEGRAFYIHDGTGVGPIIDGLAIKNGMASAATVHQQAGGAIECWGYSCTIRHCVFDGNVATVGGALYFNPSLHPQGPVPGTSQPAVTNCTFVANHASDSGSVYFQNGYIQTTFSGCVMYSNAGSYPVAGSETVLECCDLYGNSPGNWISWIADQETLRGNFSADPRFCEVLSGDYHLSAYSPCTPVNNYWNSTLIGALSPNCGTFVCGDANMDGQLTDADVDLLRTYYFSLASTTYIPFGTIDMDCSDRISINDLVMLTGYLYGFGPTPCCAPQPKHFEQPSLEHR